MGSAFDAEPVFPGLKGQEYVVVSLSDPELLVHAAYEKCSVLYPHQMKDCALFLVSSEVVRSSA